MLHAVLCSSVCGCIPFCMCVYAFVSECVCNMLRDN